MIRAFSMPLVDEDQLEFIRFGVNVDGNVAVEIGHQVASEFHFIFEVGVILRFRDASEVKVLADKGGICDVAQVVFIVAATWFKHAIDVVIKRRWSEIQWPVQFGFDREVRHIIRQCIVDLNLS